VPGNSLLTVRPHRLNFYVVLRKLIPKLQSFSQCIQETPMVRFYSSIYTNDKMLIRQMSYDRAFHGSPHQIAGAQQTMTDASAAFPIKLSLASFVVEIRSFWRDAVTFEVEVAERPVH